MSGAQQEVPCLLLQPPGAQARRAARMCRGTSPHTNMSMRTHIYPAATLRAVSHGVNPRGIERRDGCASLRGDRTYCYNDNQLPGSGIPARIPRPRGPDVCALPAARCLLAYVKHRADELLRLRWECGTSVVPANLQVNQQHTRSHTPHERQDVEQSTAGTSGTRVGRSYVMLGRSYVMLGISLVPHPASANSVEIPGSCRARMIRQLDWVVGWAWPAHG